jgi:hypothetical protein
MQRGHHSIPFAGFDNEAEAGSAMLVAYLKVNGKIGGTIKLIRN